MKKISILGSTGSIGRQTLDIVRALPDRLKVVALAAGKSKLDQLAQQIEIFEPEYVSLPDLQSVNALKDILLRSKKKLPEIGFGPSALIEAATHPQAELVVTAVVGTLGLLPTEAAIKAGKNIALANKETLVSAGSVIMPLARRMGVEIIPVDSEHSAIFQAATGYGGNKIREIWLTGSGGPFRTKSTSEIKSATVESALKHPNWSMGPKITIDSATMMNKGLEIIEARWLFDVQAENVRVVIHPQSIVHSAVEFIDGSVIAQMGLPDMRLPIHFALFHPERVEQNQVPRLSLTKLATLTFEEPDYKKFPCLALCRQVAQSDTSAAAVLNAANEIAVDAFLKKKISFSEIYDVIESVLSEHKQITSPSLDVILEIDAWARQKAESVIASQKTRKVVAGMAHES